MATKAQLSINAAVTVCVARCMESQTPLCCLAECLEQLKEMGWTAGETNAVESAVIAELGKLRPTTDIDRNRTTLAPTKS